ncbi:MAG: zf-HC2 domain-containing protein [Chloroflexi bacterium]|nr:zf-HC2 domain-containing protein [Chloroflexota bacterium]
MNCNIAQQLTQHFLDNALSQAEARTLELHLEGCRDCRSYFIRLERTTLAVESLPRLAAPPDLYVRTMAAVAQSAAAPRQPQRRWADLGLMAFFALAGLLIALQSGPELADSLADLELADPFSLVDSLFVVAASLELSLLAGAALIFAAGCGTLARLIAWGQPSPAH